MISTLLVVVKSVSWLMYAIDKVSCMLCVWIRSILNVYYDRNYGSQITPSDNFSSYFLSSSHRISDYSHIIFLIILTSYFLLILSSCLWFFSDHIYNQPHILYFIISRWKYKSSQKYLKPGHQDKCTCISSQYFRIIPHVNYLIWFFIFLWIANLFLFIEFDW